MVRQAKREPSKPKPVKGRDRTPRAAKSAFTPAKPIVFKSVKAKPVKAKPKPVKAKPKPKSVKPVKLVKIPLRITTASLSPVMVGGPTSQPITATGGSRRDYSWRRIAGHAAGLRIARSVTPSTSLSGTPVGVGAHPFTVRVSDSAGNAHERTLTLVVVARPKPKAKPKAKVKPKARPKPTPKAPPRRKPVRPPIPVQKPKRPSKAPARQVEPTTEALTERWKKRGTVHVESNADETTDYEFYVQGDADSLLDFEIDTSTIIPDEGVTYVSAGLYFENRSMPIGRRKTTDSVQIGSDNYIRWSRPQPWDPRANGTGGRGVAFEIVRKWYRDAPTNGDRPKGWGVRIWHSPFPFDEPFHMRGDSDDDEDDKGVRIW